MGFKEFSDGVHEVDLGARSEGNIDDLNIENYVGVGAGILDIEVIFSVGLFIDFEGEPAAGPVFVGLADRGDDERLHIVTADPDGVDVGEGLLG